MAYQKKDPQETSLKRSIAGRKGGEVRRLNAVGRMRTKNIQVYENDHKILSIFAQFKKLSIAASIHSICIGLAQKYGAEHPELNKLANANPPRVSDKVKGAD